MHGHAVIAQDPVGHMISRKGHDLARCDGKRVRAVVPLLTRRVDDGTAAAGDERDPIQAEHAYPPASPAARK